MWWDAIINLFSKKTPPLPNPAIYQMTGTDMWALLDAAGLTHPFGVFDGIYNYTDLTGWKIILPLLLSDKSVIEFEDCEDLSLQATLDSSVKYHLNSIGLAVGTRPSGNPAPNDRAEHGFCFLYIKDIGFMLFEPQRGFGYGGDLFAFGQNGYAVSQVLI